MTVRQASFPRTFFVLVFLSLKTFLHRILLFHPVKLKNVVRKYITKTQVYQMKIFSTKLFVRSISIRNELGVYQLSF